MQRKELRLGPGLLRHLLHSPRNGNGSLRGVHDLRGAVQGEVRRGLTTLLSEMDTSR